MFEKFTVIDLIKTRSASICTVTGDSVRFNPQTAQELNYASHVQFLINVKEKQFAIQACKEDAPNSVPFSKPEGKQKYQIRVSNHTVADVIRKLTGWSEDENWSIPGIYFAEEHGIMYDLTTAYKPKPRGGWAAKRAKEAAAAAAEARLEEGADTESKD